MAPLARLSGAVGQALRNPPSVGFQSALSRESAGSPAIEATRSRTKKIAIAIPMTSSIRPMSVCTGAFALGAAGLLDGRRCTTHWRHTDRLKARYPAAVVDPGVLYVADDKILTSAGTAAAVDCGLHLIRQVQGSAVATQIARRMVVPPHREGGQAQYIETPVPAAHCETLQPLLTEVMLTLDRPHTVETMAEFAHLAPRTFARKFRAETGVTPHDWLIGQRLLLARQLLEDSGLGIDTIAERAGFGSAQNLRHHFAQRLSTTPQAYRGTFRSQPV
jgi:AraC family transcriptional activator FtrA